MPDELDAVLAQLRPPASPAAPQASTPTAAAPELAAADLVWWSTSRQSGIGQIISTQAEVATIRPWLPVGSHTVTVPVAGIRRICSLAEATTRVWAEES